MIPNNSVDLPEISTTMNSLPTSLTGFPVEDEHAKLIDSTRVYRANSLWTGPGERKSDCLAGGTALGYRHGQHLDFNQNHFIIDPSDSQAPPPLFLPRPEAD